MKWAKKTLLKKGQIKFSKEAIPIAYKYFIKKDATKFLHTCTPDKPIPTGLKDLSMCLFELKQDAALKNKVYTSDTQKAIKLFKHLLIKENRLSLITFPSYGCALYILKNQQEKFDKLKKETQTWPIVEFQEGEKKLLSKFTKEMNQTTTIDLSDLILRVKLNANLSKPNSDILDSNIKQQLEQFVTFFNNASITLDNWKNYFFQKNKI